MNYQIAVFDGVVLGFDSSEREESGIYKAGHGVLRAQPLSYWRKATSWKGSPIPTVDSASSTALRSLGICRRRACHSGS